MMIASSVARADSRKGSVKSYCKDRAITLQHGRIDTGTS